MSLQYTTVDEKSFAYGIDARSAENQVKEGFIRDLVNGDIIEGRVKKRKGYVSYAGNVPVRVLSYRQESGNKVCFTLDGSIDLSRVDSTPIIVYGRTSLAGPFPPDTGAPNYTPTNSLKYYTGWTANLRKVMSANTTGTITAPASEHGVSSSNLFVGLAISTGIGGDLSAEMAIPDNFSINATTYDVVADYTNGDGQKDTFLFYLGRTAITGETYSNTYSRSDNTPITIPAATHQLATYNIVPQIFIDVSGSWQKIIPESFTIDTVTGEVNCIVDVTSSTTVKVLLSAVSSAQAKDVQLSTGSNQTLTVTDINSPFIFGALYTKSGTVNSLVFPDTTTYNDTTGNVTLTYTNNSTAFAGSYFFNYGTIRANELCVTDTVSVYNTDSSPQLTLYGLDHATIYGEEKQVNRRGWVNHIDSYRSPNTTHVVAGLGGNLFAALTSAEAPPTYIAGMPTYYARLQSRLAAATNIGPAFYDSGAAPARTRGTVAFDNGGTNWATITGVAYQPLTGWTRYTLSTPNQIVVGAPIAVAPFSTAAASVSNSTTLTVTNAGSFPVTGKILVAGELYSYTGLAGNTLSGITPRLTTTGGVEVVVTGYADYLTVKNMSHSRHSGDFEIRAIGTYGSNSLTIDVANPQITNDDYDDAGCAGLGGIFTDQLPFTAPDEFIAGDQLLSSSWGEDVQLVVKGTSGTTTVITNVYDYRALATGLLVSGQRTGDTLAFRNATNTAIVDYLVAGDVLTCSALDYPIVISSVNTTDKTVTLDNPITWYDDTTNVITFSVSRRWIPREMPLKDSGDSLINDKITRYFANNSYDSQPFLRSAMVQNNMYLTNGDDEVYKYDGLNTYRAGIIPWQPGLFSIIETTGSGGIPLAPGVADDSGTGGKTLELLGGRIKIDKTQAAYFTDGDTVLIQDGTVSPVASYTVTIAGRELETSGTHYLFSFKEPLPFTTLGTNSNDASVKMIKCYFARYYFRLNMKDRNGVTVASAVTGSQDFVVQVAPTTTDQQKVHLRLVGLPAWDHYDYNNKNIEVETYRTLWTTTAVGEVPTFYRLPQVKTCAYRGADGYLDIIDTYNNETLTEVDSVVGVLGGVAIAAGWNEPPRGKYLTTAGNRLVLANLTDSPTMAVQYIVQSGLLLSDFAGQTFTFSRDASTVQVSKPTTDMNNYATYELVNNGGTQVLIAAFAATTGGFTVSLSTSVSAGDWLYLSLDDAVSHPLDFCGWWQVSSVTGTGPYVCTILSTKTYVTPTHNHRVYFATNKKDIPVNIGTDYNMRMFNGSTATAPEVRILRRVGEAINATMRMTITSSFTPWLIARSESDVGGQLIVTQPRADATLPALVISGGTSKLSTFVNGNLTATATSLAWADRTKTTGKVTRYPSRIAVSYPNYPEIFHNLWTVAVDDSDSVLDINSADGQEITGVIPFFGESAFGAALQGGVLVVFKQNSIYLVNLDAKAEGKNAIERLETQGLGCTAPYSIAPTKDGIAFANDSGIYVLRRNQRIEYLGRYMERKWQNEVDRDALAIVQGHHYNVGRQYKLSVPLSASSTESYAENSEVYVYNHTNEGTDEPGGWGRYTNHPATGWANLFEDAFYASVNGSVMRLRNEDVPQDYRDGSDAIGVVLEGRATDFGQGGIRKVVSHVVVNYRTGGISENTTLEASPDLLQQYDSTTPFAVVSVPVDNGFSTTAAQDVVTIRHSLVRRRCVYMTVKISNNGLDEALEIAGMSYVVAGLNSKGITQAANTKK